MQHALSSPLLHSTPVEISSVLRQCKLWAFQRGQGCDSSVLLKWANVTMGVSFGLLRLLLALPDDASGSPCQTPSLVWTFQTFSLECSAPAAE